MLTASLHAWCMWSDVLCCALSSRSSGLVSFNVAQSKIQQVPDRTVEVVLLFFAALTTHVSCVNFWGPAVHVQQLLLYFGVLLAAASCYEFLAAPVSCLHMGNRATEGKALEGEASSASRTEVPRTFAMPKVGKDGGPGQTLGPACAKLKSICRHVSSCIHVKVPNAQETERSLAISLGSQSSEEKRRACGRTFALWQC